MGWIVVNTPSRHDLGLDGLPLVSLQDAREAAFENRKQARWSEDLLAAGQHEGAPTFEEALEKVITLHQSTWKDGGRMADSWRACLRQYALPKIGRRQVSEITAADVLDIVGSRGWHDVGIIYQLLMERYQKTCPPCLVK